MVILCYGFISKILEMEGGGVGKEYEKKRRKSGILYLYVIVGVKAITISYLYIYLPRLTCFTYLLSLARYINGGILIIMTKGLG